jgi:hypothetical protein
MERRKDVFIFSAALCECYDDCYNCYASVLLFAISFADCRAASVMTGTGALLQDR